MKLEILIDKNCEETVKITAREKTPLVCAIENLIEEHNTELIGYIEREAVKLSLSDIYCFTVELGRVYAVTENNRYLMRCRLYSLEETLPESFVKINQSSIANIGKIERFRASFSGALEVVFKNGNTDYVSRRNVKKIKERMGL